MRLKALAAPADPPCRPTSDVFAFNRYMAKLGFIRPAHGGIVVADGALGPLLDKMTRYHPHIPIFRMEASDL